MGTMRLLYRFFTPILLLGAAAFVAWNNARGGEIISFVYLDRLFPKLAGDLPALGQISVGILFVAGLLTGALRVRGELRERGAPDSE